MGDLKSQSLAQPKSYHVTTKNENNWPKTDHTMNAEL